ncbi:MAG: hypothetical protein ACREPR_22105 [Brasilonema sp.]
MLVKSRIETIDTAAIPKSGVRRRQCGGRVPRHKGASAVLGSPQVEHLASTAVQK